MERGGREDEGMRRHKCSLRPADERSDAVAECTCNNEGNLNNTHNWPQTYGCEPKRHKSLLEFDVLKIVEGIGFTRDHVVDGVPRPPKEELPKFDELVLLDRREPPGRAHLRGERDALPLEGHPLEHPRRCHGPTRG